MLESQNSVIFKANQHYTLIGSRTRELARTGETVHVPSKLHLFVQNISSFLIGRNLLANTLGIIDEVRVFNDLKKKKTPYLLCIILRIISSLIH